MKSKKKKVCRIELFPLLLILWFIVFFNPASKNYVVYANVTEEEGWEKVSEILLNIIPPVFPKQDFIITDFGAVNDGKTLSTNAFKKAIEECNKKGGGRVIVPKGEFVTGAIHLKSNINLYISREAVLKFSIESEDYLPLVHTRWEGVELLNYSPLIYAYGQENIAITGEGTLDGQANGNNWWYWKGKEEYGWNENLPSQNKENSRPRLMKLNDEKIPLKERIFGEGFYLRPPFVQFYNCKNILIESITLKDSPFWFIHPVLSRNITVNNVKILGKGPNNDGCNPESCTDVLIKSCTFDTGDDCIAIKSGRNYDGRNINIPSSNIVIQNCTMNDGHGGVVIGSEISGGCNNVFAEDCTMDSPNLDRALRIKTNSKRGGAVEDIYMRNVKIGEVKEAVVKINLKYEPEEAIGYTYFPVVRNVFVENVVSSKSKYALFLDGLEESYISQISIKNCTFNGIEKCNYLEKVKDLQLINTYINGELVK